MPNKTSSNQSNSNSVNKGTNSGGANRSSSNSGGTLNHSAVHKPVPGSGGKSK